MRFFDALSLCKTVYMISVFPLTTLCSIFCYTSHLSQAVGPLKHSVSVFYVVFAVFLHSTLVEARNNPKGS